MDFQYIVIPSEYFSLRDIVVYVVSYLVKSENIVSYCCAVPCVPCYPSIVWLIVVALLYAEPLQVLIANVSKSFFQYHCGSCIT